MVVPNGKRHKPSSSKQKVKKSSMTKKIRDVKRLLAKVRLAQSWSSGLSVCKQASIVMVTPIYIISLFVGYFGS